VTYIGEVLIGYHFPFKACFTLYLLILLRVTITYVRNWSV